MSFSQLALTANSRPGISPSAHSPKSSVSCYKPDPMSHTLIDLASWFLAAIIIPGLMVNSVFQRKVTVEVGDTDGTKSGKARRSHLSPDQFLTRPHPEISTLYDLLRVNAARFNPTRPLFGTREVVRVVEEEKVVVKNVGGVETKETKVWKFFELSEFSWITYKEGAQITLEVGAGLRKLGLGVQSKVTIFASTGRDWMLMAHGCFSQNMLITTAYDTLGEEGLSFSLNEGEVTTLFTQADLLPMVKKIGSQVPTLANVIYTGKATDEQIASLKAAHPHLSLYTMNDIRMLGVNNPVDPVAPSPEDLCCIMYTSGSTGNPKGVMLTHANIVAAMTAAVKSQEGHLNDEEVYLAYLPLAHVLEFTVEHVCMLIGASLGYGSVRTLSDGSVRNCKGDIRELRPTLMAGVPAVWETIRKGVLAKLADIKPAQRAVFDFAYHLKWSLLKAGLPTKFLDSLVFKTVKQQTGGRLKIALSGGAPMAPESQKFMTTCVCPVVQGYGLTETCGTLALQSMTALGQLGAVGAPLPCNELKLVAVEDTDYTPFPKDPKDNPRGEVWARGGSIMKGYYKQPNLTSESITPDGWFMTGDIGEWLPDGSLAIIDRKKNLVKLSNGEYVALEKLEAQYKMSVYVTNLCIHADSLESYVVGIIVPSEKHIRDLAKSLGLFDNAKDAKENNHHLHAEFADLCDNPKIVAKVLVDLKETAKSANFKPAEMLQTIVLSHEEWTPQNGLLTAAQKIKRGDIVKKHAADIKRMYHRN
ncbi:hypothetical protein BASA61_001699 [Batrachochytrium salamandrivorans]|nr:hypothetical protein BASA61_001699 [Batrachochytrium salamandrivorans]KAH9277249.1 hypothetical protein BASA83_000114 [Batrachochytrium salamandrivorans]